MRIRQLYLIYPGSGHLLTDNLKIIFLTKLPQKLSAEMMILAEVERGLGKFITVKESVMSIEKLFKRERERKSHRFEERCDLFPP